MAYMSPSTPGRRAERVGAGRSWPQRSPQPGFEKGPCVTPRKPLPMASGWDYFRIADVHVSHLSSEGTGVSGTLGRACKHRFQGVQRATYASRHRFLRSAEPDIHLLSRAPKSHHRRLSLCSLPVPKQFVESLGRMISFAQSATCRTWQSAQFVHPVYFGSIYAAAVLRSSAGVSLSAADPRQADTLPSSGLRQVSPDCHFLSAFPGRRSRLAHSSVSEPAWQLRLTFVGYACYAVSKAACASSCPPSSVHLRRVRNS